METLFVLTAAFVISVQPPLTGSSIVAFRSLAECQSEATRFRTITREQRFELISAECKKRIVQVVNGKFEIEPGRWEALPQ